MIGTTKNPFDFFLLPAWTVMGDRYYMYRLMYYMGYTTFRDVVEKNVIFSIQQTINKQLIYAGKQNIQQKWTCRLGN